MLYYCENPEYLNIEIYDCENIPEFKETKMKFRNKSRIFTENQNYYPYYIRKPLDVSIFPDNVIVKNGKIYITTKPSKNKIILSGKYGDYLDVNVDTIIGGIINNYLVVYSIVNMRQYGSVWLKESRELLITSLVNLDTLYVYKYVNILKDKNINYVMNDVRDYLFEYGEIRTIRVTDIVDYDEIMNGLIDSIVNKFSNIDFEVFETSTYFRYDFTGMVHLGFSSGNVGISLKILYWYDPNRELEFMNNIDKIYEEIYNFLNEFESSNKYYIDSYVFVSPDKIKKLVNEIRVTENTDRKWDVKLMVLKLDTENYQELMIRGDTELYNEKEINEILNYLDSE